MGTSLEQTRLLLGMNLGLGVQLNMPMYIPFPQCF